MCNLPSALLAEWPGSFMCRWGNTGLERTPNKSQNTKLTLEQKTLLPLLQGFKLATFWSRSPTFLPTSYPNSPVFTSNKTTNLITSLFSSWEGLGQTRWGHHTLFTRKKTTNLITITVQWLRRFRTHTRWWSEPSQWPWPWWQQPEL